MFPDLVEYIVKSLVDYPDRVSVRQVETGPAITLELTVAESDMGRIIGKGGRVVNAIRALLQALAARQGKRVTLEIV
jgi:predicted RNA-binding protein YlqC (UPF0109 family)